MTVRIEDHGAVRTIIHERYEVRNAMDPESAEALYAAFKEFEDDAEMSVAVLFGAGGAFCAGWDLKYAATLMNTPDPMAPYAYPETGGHSLVPRGPMAVSYTHLTLPTKA